MKEGARHVIRRQILELAVTSESQARAIQDEAHRICRDRLIPMMDGVFASLDVPDAVFRVERLELNLDPVSSSNLEEDLLEQLRRHLPSALAKKLDRLLEKPVEQGRGRLSPTATRLELIEIFLRTGTLPWWSVGSFSVELLFEKVIEKSSEQVEALLRRIMTRRVARRLAKQLASRTQRRLAEILVPGEAAELERAVLAWQELLLDRPERRQEVEVIVREETLYFLAVNERAVASTRTLSEHLLRRFVNTQNLEMETLVERLLTRPDLGESTPASLRTWLRELTETTPDPHDRGSPRRAFTVGQMEMSLSEETLQTSSEEKSGGTGVQKSTKEGQPLEPIQEGQQKQQDGADDSRERGESRRVCEAESVPAADVSVGLTGHVELPPPEKAQPGDVRVPEGRREEAVVEDLDSQYLNNAGLVLAWPFLVRFFRRIELVDVNSFRSSEAQERAVLVLQHLVTGQSEWPEHELFLNKLLCGWLPEEPVGKKIELTELESKDAQDLLESMIEQWRILKKTSVDGFRESFLQREGRLSLQENGWSLKVARASYDVLLDQLPWGISVVLLPWMKAPIFVEWSPRNCSHP